MTAITEKANLEYRDMEAPGSSVPNDPDKTGIRELFAIIDVALGSLGVNGAITVKKATLALLDADLAHIADTLAVVYNDATAANNGIYAKVGGSGSGSWSLTALALPASFADDLAAVLAQILEVDAAVFDAEQARDQAESALLEIQQMVAEGPDAASVVGKLNKVTTRAALADQNTGVIYAWVAEVLAFYKWDAASVVTADGWCIIAATGGGTGRWVMFSPRLTVPTTSGDRTADLVAAAQSCATNGFELHTPGQYSIGLWTFPAIGSLTNTWAPTTVFTCTLDPDVPSPANAAIFCTPGAADVTTALGEQNQAGENTLLIDAEPVFGGGMVTMLRVLSNKRGNRYTVKSYVAEGPKWRVTLDRPVLEVLPVASEVLLWKVTRSRGHKIIGNGGKLTGTATRMIEFICTEDCEISGIVGRPVECQSFGSFDIAGHNNRSFDNDIEAGAAGGINGWLLETQEQSYSANICRGFSTDGVRWLNSQICVDESSCSGNAYGITVGGESNLLGTKASAVRGVYDGNTVDGIAVLNGSSFIDLTGSKARFNTTNVTIGDPSGGAVSDISLAGDFRAALQIGVKVDSTVLNVLPGGGETDTSGSGIGVLNLGSANLILDHVHRGGVSATDITVNGTPYPGSVLYNNGGQVTLQSFDYNVTTAGVNIVTNAGAGRLNVLGGYGVGVSTAVLFNCSGTSRTKIGAAIMAGAAAGAYVNTNAFLEITDQTEFQNATPYFGPGTVRRPGRVLSSQISVVQTTAVTTEETLKTYSIPAGSLRPGDRLEVRVWGTTANNANVKQLRFKFGGTTILFQNQPQNAGWSTMFEIWVTGASAQETILRHNAGSAVTCAVGPYTKDDTAAIVIAMTGQNGTASAGDIVCRGMEVRLLPAQV